MTCSEEFRGGLFFLNNEKLTSLRDGCCFDFSRRFGQKISATGKYYSFFVIGCFSIFIYTLCFDWGLPKVSKKKTLPRNAATAKNIGMLCQPKFFDKVAMPMPLTNAPA